ncbi:DUF2157 domain-containing protein [Nodularia harveyana UHCC-0300]|uniref:DUF2157 domain-containing protein n=1 Tax=Nodularia harveyana UHCC-0300 TaxID=2974287 RepID=A0ABU5UB78_9CYAN|nr:DUF2157 domain-containing protein [Nodularia harveyana]MEA5580781.1 DUF2157 domain-containing protein [Nodularia harveyana UHCC-0300]
MPSPVDEPLTIILKLPSFHPELLTGLDIWLDLGLISDRQVRQLCQQFLVCEVVLEPVTLPEPEEVTALRLKASASSSPRKTPQKPPEPNFVSSMLQSLGAELSVRWLLFLGLFLVVLSSGVLAASQWERFPAAAQYGVLFAYTLSFWGFSSWAEKQNNLRLTAQTLLIVTLLLIPVNFWAMDSFQLWHNPLNWLTVAIATPTLTFITVLLCKNTRVFSNLPTGKLPLVNILGLSYLHWGWELSYFPLFAIYLAMVGTTIVTIYHHRYPQQPPITSENPRTEPNQLGISLFGAVIIYGLVVLLVRAIFVNGVNITQLGLAIGICGWLVTWLAQHRDSTSLWQRLGSILLFLGWLVAVFTQPAQAILVSGLALVSVGNRLKSYSSLIDLATFFTIGLQTIWLGWRLVPGELQQQAIAIATQLTHTESQPWALLGVALFPYLIFMVVITEKIHHRQHPELGQISEFLTLVFGAFLTAIAYVNPTLRSLNLLFSTITLIVITQRRSPVPIPLVYFTHIMGVLTVGSTIHWQFPNLPLYIWAGILLAVMVAEWVFSLGDGIWQQSSWYIGCGLATLSFYFLWMNNQIAWFNDGIFDHWGILWLITPLTLTGLASRTSGQRRNIHTFSSAIAVCMSQLLTLPLTETRLISLGVATALMFVNTNYLRHKANAGITVGFGLSFIGVLLWERLPELTTSGWFIVGAIATFSLWLARTVLIQRDNELATIYAVASDRWAIALCITELCGITFRSTLLNPYIPPNFLYLIPSTITLVAIVYRSWQAPTNWTLYGIGWCVELIIAEILTSGENSTLKIAIANIALGLVSQLLGEWWRRKHQLQTFPSSLHILPLIYGAISVVFRLYTFTAATGFFSLGVAFILIGVGRRKASFKPLLYLGIIGVSVSAYELLFYQMFQSTGGALGDGLIAMSALGTSIMYAYRILTPWITSYLGLTPQQLKNIAHLHWLWSSSLLMAAIFLPIDINRMVGLGTGVFLIRYAIFQGKRTAAIPSIFPMITTGEIWVYLGFLEIAAMRIYWRETAVGQWLTGPLVPWNGAIACVIAYFLYILPWENWGWSPRPWKQVAHIIPLIILWETRLEVSSITLLIAAGFYIFLAQVSKNIRLTYISTGLINWAMLRWFDSISLTNALWHITPIGFSLLYIAQVDPLLKLPNYKTARHSVRIIASGLICGWAILFEQQTPLIPGIFSLIAIFAGLALKTRAFLYIGTASFLITSCYQLIIFSFSYPFLKWIVGLLVGIILISIAANFETRRTQINTLLSSIKDQLQQWE